VLEAGLPVLLERLHLGKVSTGFSRAKSRTTPDPLS